MSAKGSAHSTVTSCESQYGSASIKNWLQDQETRRTPLTCPNILVLPIQIRIREKFVGSQRRNFNANVLRGSVFGAMISGLQGIAVVNKN